jgi:hypothetical protein
MGTFSRFEDAAGQCHAWDMPVIIAKNATSFELFRVAKQGLKWTQSYPDGRSRDVTERMATMVDLAARTKVRNAR